MTTYGEQVKVWIGENDERLSDAFKMPQDTKEDQELRDAKIGCYQAEGRALGALSLLVNFYRAENETYEEAGDG